MLGSKFKSMLADRDGAPALIHRLLTEQAFGQWRRYAVAFALMGVAAAATALGAYLIGNVINAAYVDKNLPGIIVLALVTALIFLIKALSTYGSSVMLARIGNRIVALNQRQMFNALINQNVAFFSERHSSEFMARLTTGAAAASQVINLIVTAIGRDLLSLIGLLAVMVYQDPIMSFFSFIVAPPAFVVLRKMIRRIYSIARNQFFGGTRILETMQETVQGIRTVKAFTLEDVMRRRLDANVAELENESNKWARVANRASPLMEALGGFAIAGALIYGGFRVIETGATPGQFFSFLAAFMLAYEPAKRLARLNIELNSGLVGVRILFEIIDSPPTEPNDDDKPALKITEARVEFNDVRFGYRPGEIVHPRHDLRRRARQDDRAGRTVRRRQVHGVQSDPAVLRDRRRIDRHRRPEHRRRVAPLAARAGRLCRPGRVPVPRHGPREHRHRQARRERGRDRRRRQGRACPRVRQRVPGRLRHARRRARRAAFRRRAPAHRDCARAGQERADHPAGRGDRVARIRNPSGWCRTR